MGQIAENLQLIKSSLPASVKLVAVSKFHPIERLLEAYEAGQRAFGESRAQEIAMKHQQMPADVEWHFIGHLQTNKVRQIVPYVSLIHSVDSLRLLHAINDEARKIGRRVGVLLQLHVAKEEAKFGFTVDELMQCAEKGELNGLDSVTVRGVMAMATNTDDEAEIAAEFRRAKGAFDELKSGCFAHDEAFTELSMGMSDDYKIAIAEGSTMVRIGSSIFGLREY